MTIRLAQISDADLLSDWALRPHVLAATGRYSGFDWHREIARSVPWREIWIAEADGRPVGVSVLIDAAREEAHYWEDVPPGSRALDIWLGNERDMGHGIGTTFMLILLGRVFDDPQATRLVVDPLASNTRAISFYKRLGFHSLGRRTFGDDLCEVLQLDRQQSLLVQLRAQEPVFHRFPKGTTDRSTLEAFVDPGFWEIGASGQLYERDHIIDTVLKRGPDDPNRRLMCSEFRLTQICEDVYHLGYLLDDNGRLSRRTSLWRRDAGQWRLLFHQGTALASASGQSHLQE